MRWQSFTYIVLVLLQVGSSLGRKDATSTASKDSKYPLFLNDIFQGYEESKDIINDHLSKDGLKGMIKKFLHLGKKQSVSMVEGVRKIPRGGSSFSMPTSMSKLKPKSKHLDDSLLSNASKARSSIDELACLYSIKMAWLVGVQVTFRVLISHRQNLFRLTSRLVQSDTIAAVRTIQDIFESVSDHGVVDVFKKYPTQDLIASIYALSRLQAASEQYWQKFTSRPNEKKIVITDYPMLKDDEILEDLTRYASFASATYGWKLDLATAGKLHRGDLHALERLTKVNRKDIVKVEWESRANRPAYYIVRDHAKKRIVLAIRGTWSAHDILTDLCCTTEEYFIRSKRRRHSAHSGMLESAKGVMAMTEETIEKELEEYPDFSLLLVGHSLGGSVAAILGQMWEDTFRDVRVYAYGPACVAPINDMNPKKMVSVLLEGDPFSSLSLGHVADTSRALAQLCEDGELRTNALTVTDGPLEEMDDEQLRWCLDTMSDIRKNMSSLKLYPPGRLVFIGTPKERKGVPEIREILPNIFGELKICARMFDLRRHVPRVYQRRLKATLRDLKAHLT